MSRELQNKLRINLPQQSFKLGEQLSGEIMLEIWSQLKARGLKLSLRCEEWIDCYDTGCRTYCRHRHPVYKHELLLEPPGELGRGIRSYRFNLELPNQAPPSMQGKAMGIRWILEAKLDLARKLDLRDSREIQVI